MKIITITILLHQINNNLVLVLEVVMHQIVQVILEHKLLLLLRLAAQMLLRLAAQTLDLNWSNWSHSGVSIPMRRTR